MVQKMDFNLVHPPERAFPDPREYGSKGMALRDYFAASALSGLMANSHMNTWQLCEDEIQAISKISYTVADAMMQAGGNDA